MSLETRHIRSFSQAKKTLTELLIGTTAVLMLANPAFAQDKKEINPVSKVTSPSNGLSLNVTSGSQSFASNSIDFLKDNKGTKLFNFDVYGNSCLSGEKCVAGSERLDIGYARAFKSRNQKGLNLTLTPRAALRFDDNSSSAVLGAVVEIGEDSGKGSKFDKNTWYFFAGADAEAVSYSPNSLGRLTAGQYHMQDQILVGDAQAGLGYRMGDADVSLSVSHREGSSDDFNFKEDAAAISFTWKR
jgi:hypothetical protein